MSDETEKTPGIIRAVKCLICKRLHDTETQTFITVKGGIFLGLHKDFFGSSTNMFGNIRETFYCPQCLVSALAKGCGLHVPQPRGIHVDPDEYLQRGKKN
jgi:hypothetical protein